MVVRQWIGLPWRRASEVVSVSSGRASLPKKNVALGVADLLKFAKLLFVALSDGRPLRARLRVRARAP